MKRPQLLYGKKKNLLSTVITIILAVLFSVALILYVAELVFYSQHTVIVVSGDSMLNTLKDNDYVYADNGAQVRRGDVIIINVKGSAQFPGTDYIIKRCIALEGDTVYASGGVVYRRLAGEDEYTPLDEPYANWIHPDPPHEDVSQTYSFRSYTVGEGEIFFLGDDRPNSHDAKNTGCLSIERVEGVVPQWAIDKKESIKKFETFRSDINGVWRNFLSIFGIKNSDSGTDR